MTNEATFVFALIAVAAVLLAPSGVPRAQSGGSVINANGINVKLITAASG